MPDWTADRWAEASRVLDAVLDVPSEDRTTYLLEHVADGALRAEIAAMLAAEAPAFLAGDAAAYGWPLLPDLPDDLTDAAAPGDAAAPDGAAQRVGPYRLVRVLGQGGMGTVYLAERDDGQFRRRVALKIVRGGALARSPEALARFRQERQILASLRHPGIAGLVGGGLTEPTTAEPFGLPYLALDYVDGAPITRYCDANRLGVRARLRLFAEVCEAVRYAHQNLVVHRDIKPGNILVEEDAGGTPRARLLDFGVAKLLNPDRAGLLDEVALDAAHTHFETRRAAPLTPAYAAPEQRRGEPVTTSADVYALGVLLAELLAGARPDSADARLPASVTPEAAERRGTTAPVLRATLAGDLDALARTALAHDPAERYASADALLADVRAYLGDLPLAARGPSPSYRMRRFARRHRAAVVAASLALLALFVGFGAALWQASLAREAAGDAQRELARAESALGFVGELFASLDRLDRRDATVREALTDIAPSVIGELGDEPEVRAVVTGIVARGLYALEDSTALREIDAWNALAAQHFAPEDDEAIHALAFAIHAARSRTDHAAADSLSLRYLALKEATAAPPHEVAEALNERARILYEVGRGEESAETYRDALARYRQAARTDTSLADDVATVALNLVGQLGPGDADEADALVSEAEAILRERFPPGDGEFAVAHHRRAQVAAWREDFAEAARQEELARELAARAYGEASYYALVFGRQHAEYLASAGQLGEAVAQFERLIAANAEKHGAQSREVAAVRQALGGALKGAAGYRARREAEYRAAYHAFLADAGPEHYATAFPLVSLSGLLLEEERYAEALDALDDALPILRATLGEDGGATLFAAARRAEIVAAMER